MKYYFLFFFILISLFNTVKSSNGLKEKRQIQNAYILEYADSRQNDEQHFQSIMDLLSPLKDVLQIRHVYHDSNIFSGMAIQLPMDDDDAFPFLSNLLNLPFSMLQSIHLQKKSLSSHPYIKHIYPIYEVDPPVVYTQTITNNNSSNGNSRNTMAIFDTWPYDTPITQIQQTHDLNYNGKNVFVCLLDSGVDYTHPALGGGFGPKYKIKYGANLVDPTEDDETIGYHRGENDPFDPCPDNGHGTHVAGIIAAEDHKMKYYGVAPGVKLGMWRVFGCQRGSSEDRILKGLVLAQKAGCDIVNLSLGFQNAWSEDIMAVVAERMSQQGTIVVAVSGNQAGDGVFLQNTPGTAKSVISVASINNAKIPSRVLRFNIFSNQNFMYQPSTTTESFPNGPVEVVYDSQNQGTVSQGCIEDDYNHIQQGTILLIRRGNCTFDIKSEHARNKGAKGLLIYDDQEKEDADLFLIQTTDTKNMEFPLASIHYKVAKGLIHYRNNNNNNNNKKPIQLAIEKELVNKNLSTALQVSSFTSAGPTYELELKPNIAGIGGQVFSTVPLHDNSTMYYGYPKGWAVKSGTSMASPHISGVLALVVQSFRERTNQIISSQFIIEHLQNHAKVIMSNDTFAVPDHPILQGAGLAQPFDTIMDPIHVSPSQISFNDTASLTQYKTYTLQVSNYDQNKPIILQIKHRPSLTIYPYGRPQTNNQFASSKIKKRSDDNDDDHLVIDQRKKQEQDKIIIDDTTNPFTPLEPFQKSNDFSIHIAIDQIQFELKPGETKSIELKVLLPEDIKYNYQMYGGYLQFIEFKQRKEEEEKEEEEEKIHVSVPYFGILGALNQLPIFDDGFPYLASSDDPAQLYTVDHPFQFKLSSMMNTNSKKKSISGLRKNSNDNNDGVITGLPNMICRLLTASPEIQVDVIRLNDYSSSSSSLSTHNNNNNHKRYINEKQEKEKNQLQYQGQEEQEQVVDDWLGHLPGSPYIYLERNRLQNDLYYREILWDGQVQTNLGLDQPTSYVPIGYTYALRVKALRLLGDRENPDHWEIWQSGPIIVS